MSSRRAPGSLADPEVLAARVAMLAAPHMRGIVAYAQELRGRRGPVPDADPVDGGCEARLLLLLETPGPGASPLRFVSRDNATGTAANIRRFFADAGLDRRDSVIWNAVPWIIHASGAANRAPTRAEIADGLAELPEFLTLLPRLRVVILAGRIASAALTVIRSADPEMDVLTMPHPSPTFVCTSPAIRERIVATLREAAASLGQHG